MMNYFIDLQMAAEVGFHDYIVQITALVWANSNLNITRWLVC